MVTNGFDAITQVYEAEANPAAVTVQSHCFFADSSLARTAIALCPPPAVCTRRLHCSAKHESTTSAADNSAGSPVERLFGGGLRCNSDTRERLRLSHHERPPVSVQRLLLLDRSGAPERSPLRWSPHPPVSRFGGGSNRVHARSWPYPESTR